MARSLKKGPFVDKSIWKIINNLEQRKQSGVIKTWSRRSTVIPQLGGATLAVHNGKKFIPVYITENMVGHKLGEFSPTRSFRIRIIRWHHHRINSNNFNHQRHIRLCCKNTFRSKKRIRIFEIGSSYYKT